MRGLSILLVAAGAAVAQSPVSIAASSAVAASSIITASPEQSVAPTTGDVVISTTGAAPVSVTSFVPVPASSPLAASSEVQSPAPTLVPTLTPLTTTAPALATVAVATGPVVAKNLPQGGKLIFGAWIDGTPSSDIPGYDSASKINSRLGYNVGSFSFSQGLPPKIGSGKGWNADGTADLSILDENTNAAVFLSVYPTSLNGILDQDINNLAYQLKNITATGRSVFLRFAPEMNGDWFPYGAQTGPASDFLILWNRMYAAVSTIAPAVAIVWSPNVQGPSGAYPYATYWPGADKCDWVGLSIYWKVYDNSNALAPDNYVEDLINGISTPSSFYNDFAAAYNKPFMMSEGGAAINTQFTNDGVNFTAIDPGPGRKSILMSYWNAYLFNTTFLTRYPLFRMATAFEIYKLKEDSDAAHSFISRDYRVSVDPDTSKAFSAGLASLDSQGLIQWATPIGASSTTSTTSAIVSVTAAASSSGVASSKSSAATASGLSMAIFTWLLSLFL